MTHIKYGWQFLKSHRDLWVWAILPFLLNMLLLVLLISYGYHYFTDVYDWLIDLFGLSTITVYDSWYAWIIHAGLWLITGILKLFLSVITGIMILLTGYLASFILAAPFHDILSEKTAFILAGKSVDDIGISYMLRHLWQIMRNELIKSLLFIAIPILLLLLYIIPAIGGILYIVISYCFGCFDLGFAFVDLPMSRKCMSFSERWQFAKQHKWTLMGFGSIYIVPFLYLLLSPVLAIGGSILYHNIMKSISNSPIANQDKELNANTNHT